MDNSYLMSIASELMKRGTTIFMIDPLFSFIDKSKAAGNISDVNSLASKNRFYLPLEFVHRKIPYDIAYVEFSVSDIGCYLAISFCFHSVMQDCDTSDDFNAVIEKINLVWQPQLAELMDKIQAENSMEWEIQLDDTVICTLWRRYVHSEEAEATKAILTIEAQLY